MHAKRKDIIVSLHGSVRIYTAETAARRIRLAFSFPVYALVPYTRAPPAMLMIPAISAMMPACASVMGIANPMTTMPDVSQLPKSTYAEL